MMFTASKKDTGAFVSVLPAALEAGETPLRPWLEGLGLGGYARALARSGFESSERLSVRATLGAVKRS